MDQHRHSFEPRVAKTKLVLFIIQMQGKSEIVCNIFLKTIITIREWTKKSFGNNFKVEKIPSIWPRSDHNIIEFRVCYPQTKTKKQQPSIMCTNLGFNLVEGKTFLLFWVQWYFFVISNVSTNLSLMSCVLVWFKKHRFRTSI